MAAADDTSLDGLFAEKAQLDTEELGIGAFDEAEDKVELDLEDAPFLDDDEEDDEPEEELPSAPMVLDEPSSGEESAIKKLVRRILADKRILIALILLVGLIIGVIAWLVLSEAPRPEPIPEPQVIEKRVEEPEPAPAEAYLVSWEPFWVEQKDSKGEIRFLVCKFSAPTDNEKLSWEATSKKVVIRDAIFYYLRNKNLLFLADKENVEVLKTDLLAVINQYLNNGQFENLLIENYLVK